MSKPSLDETLYKWPTDDRLFNAMMRARGTTKDGKIFRYAHGNKYDGIRLMIEESPGPIVTTEGNAMHIYSASDWSFMDELVPREEETA